MLRFSHVVLAAALLLSNDRMQYDTQSQPVSSISMRLARVPAITVIGPFVRTTNAAEMSDQGRGKIGPLWSRLMGGEAESIPGAIDKETIYAVYSNYESDENGAYDLTLGRAVRPGQQPPSKMKLLHIPAARYVIFPVADSSAGAIKSAWLSVYKYFVEHPNQHRAFTYDFEQHASNGTKILIAIK